IICSPMTSLKTSIKTITYLSDTGCLEIQGASLDTSYFDIRHVSWDSYIEVGGNRYSVPEALCGQPVSIRISLDDELRIYSNEKLVASHRLCSASSGWQTVPEHHAPLWQQVSQVEHRPLSAYEELL
ncbi:Mu transposase domain-containing protein, partial [Escherichia coli]